MSFFAVAFTIIVICAVGAIVAQNAVEQHIARRHLRLQLAAERLRREIMKEWE